MRLLLDTNAFIWWVGDDPRLGPDARATIADSANDIFVSAASAWEIEIKRAKGKLTFGDVEAALDEHAFDPLAIELSHGLTAGALPPYHRDPFDRVLIAQAQHESLTIVTADEALARYEIDVIDAAR